MQIVYQNSDQGVLLFVIHMPPLRYSEGKFPFAVFGLDPREISIDDQQRLMIRYMGSDGQKQFVKDYRHLLKVGRIKKVEPIDYKDIAVAWKDKILFVVKPAQHQQADMDRLSESISSES